ncbi:MAG: Rpn family recombination-promoting nuclease/putative transposase, partial [Planctomycetaceae bacterium]|nr:Rpn family recombination-promoting nuclease/putative transposase [Planctomycetaceae bacterium]
MLKDDNFFIKPTSDIFVVTFLSDPKNEPCLRSIINAVLKDKGEQKPIEQAIVRNPYSIRNYAVDKQIVVDVRVEAIGCAFNVEIQTCPHPAFRERALFGWSNSYSSQLSPGSDYKTLKPVIYIVITEFAVISGISRVHLLFELRERGNRNCLLSDHIQIHIWQLQELKKGNMEVLKEVSPDMS